jgi:hypothetical protein|tara:strand:+ start:3164 stop:4012 length:849 start_codon:yes stop_codon:yes gene_type:complete
MNKNLLPKELQDVLTEESVSVIETALKEKVELSVEAALTSQDELYAEKLEELVTRIDSDHTSKMHTVVEAVDKNNANKLVQVIRKYETELNEGASGFKDQLVESISGYIEEYIDEAMPVAAIEEATKNKTAYSVLTNLRSVLAVDSSLMSESVKEAIVDGKSQIDELKSEFAKIKQENEHLKEAYNKTSAKLVLEQKVSRYSDKKAVYLKKVLSDKSAKFITENFEYTARLFDKKEKEQMAVIREEAISNRTVKADAPRIVEEKVKPSTPENPYLAGLDKMK